ncbi:MAG TPA: phosphoglucomutase/phosphomannomutase family protein, partial [Thermoanaerobaculia bacterium]|nr:phosphoglucomutase/phosphomannomutase family protein [Thermoanaerobaculia bacterium]
GEESGGYAFGFHLPERDGVLSALLLLESLARSGLTLGAALDGLAAEFGRFEYGRRDVHVPVEIVRRFVEDARAHPPASVAGQAVTAVEDRDGVKYRFGERGWLLQRLSGTEPMVRLYCEHEDGTVMERVLDEARSRLAGFAAPAGTSPRA